ncbi:hypothetical protein VNI00_013859 [Paramarasmius palmivorus]|uniref:Uncharacterized protein n=1 Tax=Paramarasmius palmivorus TaxID=297713 RepID=A0AAW0BVD9_9AGAR
MSTDDPRRKRLPSSAKSTESPKQDGPLVQEVTRLNLDNEMLRHLKRSAEMRQYEAEEKLAGAQNRVTELQCLIEEHERDKRALFVDIKIRDEELAKLRAQETELLGLRDHNLALETHISQANSLLDNQNQFIRKLKCEVESLLKCNICENEYDDEIVPVTYVACTPPN